MDLKYLEEKFTRGQIEEIKKGLEEGVDVSIYANPSYSVSDMANIRETFKYNMKTMESKRANVENLGKCGDSSYYRESVKFYKFIHSSSISEMVNMNTLETNRNMIINKYMDRIPNAAFKSLCDAETLYKMMKGKMVGFVNLNIKAYILVLEQMLYYILKNNFDYVKVDLIDLQDKLRMIYDRGIKSDLTKMYKELNKITDLKFEISMGESHKAKDVEFMRNFLFEPFKTDRGYKCRFDLLTEAFENNPWDNKNVNLINTSIDEEIMTIICGDF